MLEKTGSKGTSGSNFFDVVETATFTANLGLDEHIFLRSFVENKLRILREHPKIGEPLGYALSGFYTTPVRKKYLILYGICKECPRFKSSSCKGYGDKAIVLYAFGKHDDIYKIAKRLIP